MIVQVTEFTRPHAATYIAKFVVPDTFKYRMMDMEFEGCRLTLESLNTGLWSVCIEHEDFGDFKMELVTVDDIQAALEKLIEEFDREEFDTWAREVDQ